MPDRLTSRAGRGRGSGEHDSRRRGARNLADVAQADGGGTRRRAERLFGAAADGAAPRPPRPAGEAPRSLRWAAAVVGLEALAALAAAVVMAVLAAAGSVSSTGDAIGIVVFALLAAGVLAGCARGLWRVASWARGPVVALQLLLALLGYTAAFTAQAPQVGVPMLAVAAVELYLLATPESRLAYAQGR
jgi:hypothetical protein